MIVKSLSEWYEELLPKWKGACDSEFDDEVMCQIECILNRKWQISQNTSKSLGITFAVEGESHWELIHQDAELLHKYVGRVKSDEVIKDVYWKHSLHVRTATECFPMLHQALINLKGVEV